MIDQVFWWTGLVTWVVFGIVGVLHVSDHMLDWIIKSFWSRKECMAFVWDRLKSKQITAP